MTLVLRYAARSDRGLVRANNEDSVYAGARLLTFQEAIDLVRGHPGFGMYPELKSPQLYKSRGIDQVKLFVDIVRKNGLEKP